MAVQKVKTDEIVTLVGLLLEVNRGLIRELSHVNSSNDLNSADFSALLRLTRSPNKQLRMCDLARQVDLSTSGVTTLVDRLGARGFVTRAASTADRRTTFVTITNDGERCVTDGIDELERTLGDRLRRVIGTEYETTRRTLERLRDEFDPHATSGASA